MKFLKSIMFASPIPRSPFPRSPTSLARPGRRMQSVRFRISDSRQDLHRTQCRAPQNEEQRERMSARRSVPPRPYRDPDAAGCHDTDRGEIAEEPESAPGVVWPKVDTDAERDRQKEAQEDAERARRALLLEILGPRCGRYRPFGGIRLGWEQRLIGDRLELSIDLLHLFCPVALGHR